MFDVRDFDRHGVTTMVGASRATHDVQTGKNLTVDRQWENFSRAANPQVVG
jgi:phosphohistidine swiveling domain-containing protein